jgi:hypothetical protein
LYILIFMFLDSRWEDNTYQIHLPWPWWLQHGLVNPILSHS